MVQVIIGGRADSALIDNIQELITAVLSLLIYFYEEFTKRNALL